MTAALDVRNLSKGFSTGRPAVDDVSFQIPAGEIVVLLGPSGCGKTTTLRCVAGLERPTAGSIVIGDRIMSAPGQGLFVPPRQRDVGMVFQSYAVWPHMTVKQNVAYPLKHRGIDRREMDRKVAEALELVDLASYADRPVTALSGGQMQRVALARSLSYRPNILLLDEPLSNLDAKLRIRLRADLRRIIKQTGLTALYVTHDQSEAVVLADRIGVMSAGKLLQLATPQEIYNQPADLFVANFTGASNLLEGRVVGRDGAFDVVEIANGAKLRTIFPRAIRIGDAATVAVRPENIQLSKTSREHAFPARILRQQYQGVQTSYELDLFGNSIEVNELGTGPRFAEGSEAFVFLSPEMCWGYPHQEEPSLEK
jgi:iron(III) transport system ATP-binding protein